MDDVKTGGPAFPPTHDTRNHPSGMTLRDYFAGQVLAGFFVKFTVGDVDVAWFEQYGSKNVYKMADAMIKARGEQ